MKIIFSVIYVYTVVIKNIAFQIFIILNETHRIWICEIGTQFITVKVERSSIQIILYEYYTCG